jgi:uncharacterized protein YdhG (YjbR/CyaY superfamily)
MQNQTAIDDYIAAFPPEVQAVLQHVRETIRAHAPDAVERISYSIPTYWKGENIIHFGGAKNHVGIYPGSDAIEVFTARLAPYQTSKGALQLPLNQPIPYDLIADLTDYRVKAAAQRQAAKKATHA